ncbi:MesA protein [Rhizoctonia solani AG-3 Rhs1AP]|uniref:MesA protein n=1 Tax=Rhizoctonia solani AG-3 Rhs1AP TaxID=1086054 RepID=A0A0A1ULJ7_9AGAM|nr:MesA protein [Rhizoctonia solani AG-3 Rhs1AP]
MSIFSNVYGHAAYVLLAEFDIDQGSVLTHQYPYPMGIDEQFIAEMMIPDGVHDQKSDWTIFFLNQVPENTVTNSLIDDDPVTSGEKQPLLYVLNLVRTVKNPNARRGANVKALALCTPHPYLHIFKPILTMALDDYFVQPDVQCLARLFDAVNAMDVSRAPVLSRDEMLIMRATERKDVFAEKFFGTELLADVFTKDARGAGPHDSISSTMTMDTFDTDIVTGVRSRKSSFTSDSTHSHSPPTSLQMKNNGSNEEIIAKPNGDSAHRTSLDRMSIASSIHLGNRGDNSSTGHGSVAPTNRKVINSRDTHFYTSFIRYYPRLKDIHLDLPVHCPLSTFPEEVGDFSLIKLINTFTSSNPVLGPVTPHLHPQGAQTHPLVVLFNALVSQKRILFLGQRLPAGDVANFVLAACAFGAGCSVLRGFTERAFPFVGLFHTRVLERLDSFIAGASNPVFETVPIWDVLCNINTGRITVRKDIAIPPPPPPLPATSHMTHASPAERIGQGIGASIPSTAGIGGAGAFPAPPAGLAPKSGVLRSEDDDSRAGSGSKKADESESSDSMLMEDISAVIQNHAGELLVRARVTDYVQRFVRLAARWESEVKKVTEIDHQSKPYSEGRLGSGVTFVDEALVAREMPSNSWRINAWRQTSYYTAYREDFRAHLDNRQIKTIDINHLVSRLRYGRNMSDGEADMIMRSLCAYVQTYEEVVELLALLPPHHGGLTPLCFGLFHPDPNIRDLTVDFMTNLRCYSIGLQFLGGLNYFHRFGYVRLAQQRELVKQANGSGETNGLSRSPSLRV